MKKDRNNIAYFLNKRERQRMREREKERERERERERIIKKYNCNKNLSKKLIIHRSLSLTGTNFRGAFTSQEAASLTSLQGPESRTPLLLSIVGKEIGT